MRTLKKVTALVVAIAMVLSLCCVNVFADAAVKYSLTTTDGASAVTVKQGGTVNIMLKITAMDGSDFTGSTSCEIEIGNRDYFKAGTDGIAFTSEMIAGSMTNAAPDITRIKYSNLVAGTFGAATPIFTAALTFKDDIAPGQYEITIAKHASRDSSFTKIDADITSKVTVNVIEYKTVNAVEAVNVTGKFGDPKNSVLPATVAVTDPSDFGGNVDVEWGSYDPMKATQTITGTVKTSENYNANGVTTTATVNLSKADFKEASATHSADMVEGATEAVEFTTNATVTATNGLTETVKATGTLTAAQVGAEGEYDVVATLADGTYINTTGKTVTVKVSVTDDEIFAAASDEVKALYEDIMAIPALEELTSDDNIKALKSTVSSLRSQYNKLVVGKLTDSKKLKAAGEKLAKLTNDALTAVDKSTTAAATASNLVSVVTDATTALAYEAWIAVAEDVIKDAADVTGATAANAEVAAAKAAVAAARALVKAEPTNDEIIAAAVAAVAQLKLTTSSPKYADVSAKVADQLAAAKKLAPDNAGLNAAEGEYNSVLGNMPSIAMPSIKVGKAFSVILKRVATAGDDATISVWTDENTTPVAGTFAATSQTASISMAASARAKGDTVTVYATYTIGGTTYDLAPVVATIKGNSSPAQTSAPNDRTPSSDSTASPNPTGSENPGSENPPVAEGFVDLGSVEWARTAIEALAAEGVVNGIDATHFDPNSNVTREQFAKMIVGVLGIEVGSGVTTFADVDASAWYAPYIAAAVENGLITGYSDGWFGVGDNITREDIATILYRSLGTEPEAAATFTDMSSVADYAKNAVALLSELGVVNGYENGSFGPKNLATRAEAAVMLYRFADLSAEDDTNVDEANVDETNADDANVDDANADDTNADDANADDANADDANANDANADDANANDAE